MTELSSYPTFARSHDQPLNRHLPIVVLALIAVALLAILGVYDFCKGAARE